MQVFSILWPYAISPAIAWFIANLLAYIIQFTPRFKSVLQYFSAGLIFSSVAIELIPKVSGHAPLPIAIGFIVGLVFALFLRLSSGASGENAIRSPKSILAMTAVYTLMNGVLIGISFAVGTKAGVLVTVALTIELFTLGISIINTLHSSHYTFGKKIAYCVFVGILAPIGTFLAYWVIYQLGYGQWLTGIVAFGIASLLFFTTEELFAKEKEQVSDSAWITTCFLIGILLILVLESVG
jgi:ZIP family zinc transporter